MSDSPLPIHGSRSHPRVDTSLAAVVHCGDGNAPVTIGNLSPSGAMLRAEWLPSTGQSVHIVRGRVAAEGAIVWTSAGRCGVAFATEIAIDEWLAPPSNTGQRIVDDLIALFKAGGQAKPLPARRSKPATPTVQESQLLSDLGLVARLLDALAGDLAGSPSTVSRHGAELEDLVQAVRMLSDAQLAKPIGRELSDIVGAVFQRLVDAEDELTSDMDTIAQHCFKLQNLDLSMQVLTEMALESLFGSAADYSGNARLSGLRVACGKALAEESVPAIP